MSTAAGPIPEKLAIETVSAGEPIWRSHGTEFEAWHLSVGKKNRFDDPDEVYGVCYAAKEPAGAFAETFLRQPRGQFIDEQELEATSLAMLTFDHTLRLVQLYGAGLWPGMESPQP